MFALVSSLCWVSLSRFLPPHVAGKWWWERFGAALSAQLSTGVKGGLTKGEGGGRYIMMPSSAPRIFYNHIDGGIGVQYQT